VNVLNSKVNSTARSKCDCIYVHAIIMCQLKEDSELLMLLIISA